MQKSTGALMNGRNTRKGGKKKAEIIVQIKDISKREHILESSSEEII